MRNLCGGSSRDYAKMPWGQVHYRHGGDRGAPTVFALHQSPLSSATYEAVITPLAKRGIRVIAPDTPGFGMSDPTPRAWQIPDYARAVWQFVEALDLQEVYLLGQHTGAVIAVECAVQRPRRVRGVVLQGLPLYSNEERIDKMRTYAPAYHPTTDGAHIRMIRERIQGLYPRLGVPESDRQLIEYLSASPDYASAYRAVFDYHLKTKVLEGVPVLLLHGADDLVDRFTPDVTAAIPNAQLVTLPGTDFIMDEDPETYAEVLSAQLWTMVN